MPATYDIWNQRFTQQVAFAPIASTYLEKANNFVCWPNLQDYNNWVDGKSNIRFVPQAKKTADFAAQYEPRIYLKGEVQTRAENWHDFFNTLVWLTFPKLKASLNAQQYKYIKQRYGLEKSRTKIENILTLFDEGGVIVFSSNNKFIELLQNFNWQQLFYEQRDIFAENMQVFIFGHALYEKLLTPYLGITGNAIILQVPTHFMRLSLKQQLDYLDAVLAKKFIEDEWVLTMHPFQPLPVLGIPGWYAENNAVNFYSNVDYFRPKSNRKNVPVIEIDLD